MRMQKLFVVFSAATVSLISASEITAQSRVAATVALPTPPAVVGPYKRDTSQNLGPDGGWLHRYTGGNSGRISVFIYPVPAGVKEGLTEPRMWTTREGENFTKVLAIQKEDKAIQDFVVAISRPDSAMNGAEIIPGYFVVAATKGPGRNNLEFCVVHYVKGVFVKVRATVPPDVGSKSDAYGFADLLARLIARNN